MDWTCGPWCPFFGRPTERPATRFRKAAIVVECQKCEDGEMGGYGRNNVGGECLQTLAEWETELPKLTAAIAARRAAQANTEGEGGRG